MSVITVRLSAILHECIAKAARNQSISMNEFCVKVLEIEIERLRDDDRQNSREQSA